MKKEFIIVLISGAAILATPNLNASTTNFNNTSIISQNLHIPTLNKDLLEELKSNIRVDYFKDLDGNTGHSEVMGKPDGK